MCQQNECFIQKDNHLMTQRRKGRMPRLAASGLQGGDGTKCSAGLLSYPSGGRGGRASVYIRSQPNTLQSGGSLLIHYFPKRHNILNIYGLYSFHFFM